MFRFDKFSAKGLRRKALLFSMVLSLSAPAASGLMTAYAAAPENATVMENCGAYLFTWRPVDCGNGEYFVILNGQNSIAESNVILNRGYDYAYTFDSTQAQPWGNVPDLVNVGGVWAIPENWGGSPGRYPARAYDYTGDEQWKQLYQRALHPCNPSSRRRIRLRSSGRSTEICD